VNEHNSFVCQRKKEQINKNNEIHTILSTFENQFQIKANEAMNTLEEIKQMGFIVPNSNLQNVSNPPDKINTWRTNHMELLQNVESLEPLQERRSEISHCFSSKKEEIII